MEITNVPVFILAGGLGTRIKEETQLRPKPMVPVGEHPILWHIMKKYSLHGFKRFIICAGFKSQVIKAYFLNYDNLNSDFTVNLKTHRLEVHSTDHNDDWEVTIADTGVNTMTGARVAIAARKYLGDSEHFAVTYGDGVTSANLADEFAYHRDHGKIGTVLGIVPPSRFGEFKLTNDLVVEFSEKPQKSSMWINGGFFFFRRKFLTYLNEEHGLVLERAPLANLAHDGELKIFRHNDFWACMDTQRDRERLEKLYCEGCAPWLSENQTGEGTRFNIL